MKEAAFDVPGLKAIRQACDEVDLDGDSRLVILTAPMPECIMASVLLSMAMLRVKGTFHIKYGEPIYSARRIETILEAHPRCKLAIVGVNPDENLDLGNQGFVMGVSGADSSSIALGRQGEETLAAYALALEKLRVGRTELKLALAGTLAGSRKEETAEDILSHCREQGVAEIRKGFLLFGSNFLPLIESLEYSMFPYLSQLSGDRVACEEMLDKADIPFSKRGNPILDLTPNEQQSLSENLIPMLDSRLISEVFGQDLVFPDEKSNGPMRFFSNMMVLIKVAWIRNKYGLGAAICFGDRAQQLRMLIDESLSLSKRSLDALPQMFAAIDEKSNIADSHVVELEVNVGSDLLPTLGMIVSQNGMLRSDLLLLGNRNETHLVWKREERSLRTIMRRLHEAAIESVSTSYRSLRIDEKIDIIRHTVGEVLLNSASGREGTH